MVDLRLLKACEGLGFFCELLASSSLRLPVSFFLLDRLAASAIGVRRSTFFLRLDMKSLSAGVLEAESLSLFDFCFELFF